MTFRKSGLTWIVLLLSVTLSGCISRWTEDVELGDGTIIKVTRTEKYGGGGGIGESCNFCTFEWARLSFEYNGNRYLWKSLPKSGVPMIVDVVGGIPMVVSYSNMALCVKKVSKPSGFIDKSFYSFSVAEGRSWRHEISKPDGIRTTRNLHPYKPKYSPGLSVIEKNDWVRKKASLSRGFGRLEAMIVDDANDYCAN